MRTQKRNNGLNWALIGLLSAAAIYGLFFFPQSDADTPAAEFTSDALLERFEEYAQLRYVDDWVSLYEFVDPAERDRVDRASFIARYGKGVMKTHELASKAIDLDEEEKLATMTVVIDAELLVNRLPAEFRKGFRAPEDPSELRRAGETQMYWVWREGQWYYRLDDLMLRGDNGGTTAANAF